MLSASARAGAFRALQLALEAGDDEGARRIVATLRAVALDPLERTVLESAERVLTGRALVKGLELALESEPVEGREGSYRLVLVARSNAERDVRIALPPADLKRFRATIDARGLEGMEYESKGTRVFDELVLVPTVARRVELLVYELPLGRALSVRERWKLEPRSGEIESAGESYPAAGVRVQGCARERVSPLITAVDQPERAFVEHLASKEPASMSRLLALALSIPEPARPAALRAVAPVVERLAREAPERMLAAEPALRWLTEKRDLGTDAGAWARYLATFQTAPEGAPPADGLDLPAPPRSTRRSSGEGEGR